MRGKFRSMFLPLRTKFIILFCLLITIPFLIIGTITYQKYSADVERNTTELTYQIMDQIRINLDRYVKEMERLTLAPHYDDNVMQILKNHSSSYQNRIYLTTDESLKMNLFISSLSFDRAEIESILIFTNDGSLFSNLEQSVSKYWKQDSSQWTERVKENEGGLTIIPPHDATYYLQTKKQVVSLSRVIREPYTNRTLGMVKVDLTPQGFGKLLSTVRFSEKSKLFISDGNGQLLYSSTGNTNLQAFEEDALTKDPAYLKSTVESDYSGIKVTGLIPLEDLRKDAKGMVRFTLIISLIALLFAYMIAVFSSNRLVKPIRHLQSKMRQVQRGFFKERAVVTTNDEIGQLTEGFNTMIGEIDRLIKEVYETRLRERDAELSALQSQINSHFLYNTLELISMMALQHQHLELSNIATSLGKLLRYTVDKQEKPVYLQDEIRFVESYLQIQVLGLGEKLQAEIHIDPSYDHCLVPKLILHPLIENVIEHAMESSIVHMYLTASTQEDDLLLSLRDDGKGMTKQRMEWIEQQMYMHKSYGSMDAEEKGRFGEVKKGFALRNVHQRIRLLYGEPYGLYLDKTVKQGVLFTIRLPIHWGNQGELNDV